MKPNNGINRRQFLTGTAAAAAAFTIIPRHVLGEGKVTADEFDLVTLRQIPLVKGRSRVRIAAAK